MTTLRTRQPTSSALHVASTPASSSSALPHGASSALRSVQALERARAQEDKGVVSKAVVAALVGVTLLTSMTPAHADPTVTTSPPTSGLVLSHAPTGPPAEPSAGPQRAARVVVNDSFQYRPRADDLERFLGATQPAAQVRSAEVDAVSRAAFDTFTTRLTQILHRDAASLAWGQHATFDEGSLTPTQQTAIEKAFRDLLSNLPIGVLGPRVEGSLESALSALGQDRDLSSVRLGDLGDVGGDAAKALIDELKQERRGAYNTLVGVAAAGAVAIGYTQGTDALRKLGVRPELSTRLFDGQARLRLGVDAGPRFSNPALTVGLSGQTQLDNGAVLRGAVHTRIAGGELGQTRVSGSVSTPSGLDVTGEARFEGNLKPLDLTLSATQRYDGWNLGASASYSFQNDTFSSALSAGRTFDVVRERDLDLQIRGSFDNQGNSYIGVGATFRF
jgi:hypothetical protein